MNLHRLDVAVIGAGIGGVAAALALAQRGARVRVHEQAEALSEVGAGLQISANGQAVLRALGAVTDAPPDNATLSSGTEIHDGRSGRYVTTLPGPSAGPTWYLHRADLLDLLVIAARRQGVEFALGHRVEPGDVTPDLIVAADGVQSAWRATVDGPVAATFTGQVAWRALVPWSARECQAAQLSMGTGAHVVTYPLHARGSMNLVAVEERRDWTRENWMEAGDPATLKSRFARFQGRAGAVLSEVTQTHLWALHLRPVAQRWHLENVALLGDAAHPTLPFMAQGACLALEDAWALSAALHAAPNLPSGLGQYQTRRQDRARRVVALARGNAWRFHLPRPLSWGAETVLRLGGAHLARRLDWVYAWDETTS